MDSCWMQYMTADDDGDTAVDWEIDHILYQHCQYEYEYEYECHSLNTPYGYIEQHWRRCNSYSWCKLIFTD